MFLQFVSYCCVAAILVVVCYCCVLCMSYRHATETALETTTVPAPVPQAAAAADAVSQKGDQGNRRLCLEKKPNVTLAFFFKR